MATKDNPDLVGEEEISDRKDPEESKERGAQLGYLQAGCV